jgi:hypothetical protein
LTFILQKMKLSVILALFATTQAGPVSTGCVLNRSDEKAVDGCRCNAGCKLCEAMKDEKSGEVLNFPSGRCFDEGQKDATSTGPREGRDGKREGRDGKREGRDGKREEA